MNMKTNVAKTVLVLGLAVLTALPALAKDKKNKVEERYTAIAIAMGSAGPGTNVRVTIGIEGWTTPEDRTMLLDTLVNEGPAKLKSALFKQDQLGFVKIGNSLGYPLRYAWQVEQDGKRHLVLGTERAVTSIERMGVMRSQDYDIALITMTINEDGTGEGSFAPAVELSVKDNQLQVKTYSSEAMRLTNLKKEK
jgi:hypothetical protein